MIIVITILTVCALILWNSMTRTAAMDKRIDVKLTELNLGQATPEQKKDSRLFTVYARSTSDAHLEISTELLQGPEFKNFVMREKSKTNAMLLIGLPDKPLWITMDRLTYQAKSEVLMMEVAAGTFPTAVSSVFEIYAPVQ